MERDHRRSHLTILSLLLLAAGAGLLVAQEAAGPEAVVPEAIVDFGVVDKGTPIEHEFVIRNEGGAPLEIERVKATCGCTVTEHDAVIAPGASGRIHTVVDTSEFRGPIAKSVQVFTNDTRNPRLLLVVKADVQAAVEVSPGWARFVAVQGEDYPTVEQILWSPELPELEITDVRSPYSYLAVGYRLLMEHESDYREGFNRWKIDITLRDDAPVGQMTDFVKVFTNHPEQHQVHIPVSGFVRPILAVTPRVLDFGRRELDEPQEAKLEVRNLGSQAVGLQGASSDVAGLVATIETVEAGRLYNLLLTLSPGLDKGRFRGKITVETDSPRQPVVEIDVTGTVL